MEIDGGKTGGRSRFSRPACKLLKAVILSGLNIDVFRDRFLHSDEFEQLREDLHIGGEKSYHLKEEDFLERSEVKTYSIRFSVHKDTTVIIHTFSRSRGSQHPLPIS